MHEAPQLGGNAIADPTLPWAHLDGLPSVNMTRYFDAQTAEINSRFSAPGPNAHGTPAIPKEVVPQLEAVEFMRNLALEGPPGEPISMMVSRMLNAADMLSSSPGSFAIPPSLANDPGIATLRQTIKRFGDQLAQTPASQLAEIITPPEATPAAHQAAPEAPGQTTMFSEKLPGVHPLELADYLASEINHINHTPRPDNIDPVHFGRMLDSEAKPLEHLRRVVSQAAVANGATVDSVMEALDSYLAKMRSDPSVHQGPLSDIHFRNAILTNGRKFMAEIASMDPNGLREAIARTYEQKQPETQPSRAATSETDRQALIQEVLQASEAAQGTGLYGDVQGAGLRTIVAQSHLMLTAEGPRDERWPIRVWDQLISADLKQRANTSDDPADMLVEAVAFTPIASSEPRTPRTVRISYSYEPIWAGREADKRLVGMGNSQYREANGSRAGNIHAYCVEVPEALAEKFKAALQTDVELARSLGDAIVQQHAPENYKATWNAEKAAEQQDGAPKAAFHTAYPTYHTLPPGAPIRIFDAMESSGATPPRREDYKTSVLVLAA